MLGWELPPHNSGGLGVACFYMAKALAEKGADIDFVVPYSEEHPNIDFMNILHATKLPALHKFGNGAYDPVVLKTRSFHNAPEFLPDIKSIQREYLSLLRNILKMKITGRM